MGRRPILWKGSTDMSHGRRQFVTWFIALLLVIQAAAIAAKHDNWPISCYPMFSSIQGQEFHRPALCGVSVDGQELLLDDPRYWRPIPTTELQQTIRRNIRRDQRARKKDPAVAGRTDESVQALFELYDRNRAAGWHDGPRLAALRLYTTTWELDPQLRNLDQPLRQELVYEARAPRDAAQ